MRKPGLFRYLLLGCVFGSSASVSGLADDSAIPTTALKILSTTPVPLLTAPGLSTPIYCSSDGSIFVRLADPSAGMQDLVSIPKESGLVTHFSKDKIIDVMNPQPGIFFVQGHDVYIL